MFDLIRLFEEWLKMGSNKFEVIVGFFVGMLSFFIKYLSGVLFLNIEVLGRIIEAGVMAVVGGFLGAFGVHIFDLTKKKIITFIKAKTKNQNAANN